MLRNTMIDRRHALKIGVAAAAMAALPAMRAGTASALPAVPLPIPPLIEADPGRPLALALQDTRHRFRPDRPLVASRGISADHLAPVLRLKTGDTIAMQVENRLREETTLHWHGLLVPSKVDGGPHNTISPGQRWAPELRISQPPATLWFHPHPHGATAPQVYSGLAGMMILSDGHDRDRGLPADYGVDDLPVILQDKRFHADGAPVYQPAMMDIMHGFAGDTFVVNGAIAPSHARVPAAFVRLRLLNAANARNFDLRLADRRPFFAIAGDTGYLSAPVELQRLVIAPGERYEVLVDMSRPGPAELLTGPDLHHGAGGADADQVLLRLVPDAALARKVVRLPAGLTEMPAPDVRSAVAWRSFVLDAMPSMPVRAAPAGSHAGHSAAGMPAFMTINGRAFAMDRIDFTTRLGTTEIWEIESRDMAHPFHVHGARFRVLSNGGVPPAPEQAGWKDVVLVEKHAELLVHFEHPAPADMPFMYHCHILEHEDHGMMGQFAVA